MYCKNRYKYDQMKRAEHEAVRKTVGWYIFTHELLEVTGADATIFLDRIYANPIANLKTGSARYTTMLDEQAYILDDVVIFRLGEERFWILTLYAKKALEWYNRHKGDLAVEFLNITALYCMFAVQGPNARDLMNAMVDGSVDDQKFFTIVDHQIGDCAVKVSRAGFSGEKLGYEIYAPADKASSIQDMLMEKGLAFGALQVTEFQVMVWSLPTEKGLYLMRDLLHTNPLEVGLDRGIGWDKDFIGKEALQKIKEEGPAREMHGFTVDEPDVAIHGKNLGGPGSAVMFCGEEVGRVSRFTYSYVLEKNNGFILAQRGKLKKGDVVRINGAEGVITDRVFI